MQIRLIIRDELGREVGRFPVGSWEPFGPDGISFGPGGTVVQVVDIPAPGHYQFIVQGLQVPEDAPR